MPLCAVGSRVSVIRMTVLPLGRGGGCINLHKANPVPGVAAGPNKREPAATVPRLSRGGSEHMTEREEPSDLRPKGPGYVLS
jgi:hypothetical protein